MESFIRFGLLGIALLILAVIFLDSWRRRRESKIPVLSRQENIEHRISDYDSLTPPEPCIISEPPKETVSMPDDIISIAVYATPGNTFASYDLLQAISARGLQYGEMNIFHYYISTPEGKTSLFSLASATKPGDFDLSRMGDFSCIGLVLFMQLHNLKDPESAFELMLTTAEQLAEDLEGEVRQDKNTPWSDSILKNYQHKLRQYQSRYA